MQQVQLTIDGIPRTFTDLVTFRAEHELPDSFGLALFEPPDSAGLGRIDRAGDALRELRQRLLDGLPDALPLNGWMPVVTSLGEQFEETLRDLNRRVGLRAVEIEVAAAGFQDVCQSMLYALIRARVEGKPAPAFAEVYAEWLNSTVRISQTRHAYARPDKQWDVQVVSHAYGCAGLVIDAGEQTYYVHDPAQSYPVEGFMAELMAQVAARMHAAR